MARSPRTKAPKWQPMFALPNILLQDAIEVDGFALAPLSDPRIQTMSRNARFRSFLRRFKTEFGDPVQPAVIIWRNDKPQTYRAIAAIAGFRDAVSMSAIPIAWAKTLRWQRNMGALYGDYFAFYPWMVDNRNNHLITRTPVMFGIHEVKRLRAQTVPALSPCRIPAQDLDSPLLEELLRRWERCFSADNPGEDDERLFRSLNMANAAALMPAGVDNKLYDVLRAVALWATAFEILKPSKNQAYKKVYEVLEGIKWNLSHCKQETYTAYGDDRGKLRKLPVWLYGEITHLRNDTLHGNPLPPERLIVPPGKQSIAMYAAPLYRMMLAAILELKHSPKTSREGLSEYDAYGRDMFEFGHYQRDIEAALATVLLSDEEQDEQRRPKPHPSAGPPEAK
jgi:hypothetical protein